MTRRALSRRMLLAAALGFTPGRAGAVPAIRSSTGEAAEAARLLNAYRATRGLAPLRVDARLSAAAADQARMMASTGLLSHDVAGSFAARMQRLGAPTASENLGMGYRSVAEAVAAWRASPAHHANLVRPHRRMGLGRAEVPGGGPAYWALILAP
jgi:uncharacterized protein YkwD